MQSYEIESGGTAILQAIVTHLHARVLELEGQGGAGPPGPQGPPGVDGSALSNPPPGKYRVTNLWVDPVSGTLTVEYDDTPA